MPLYEFQCDACGNQFEELFRSMTERRRPKCPVCKSRRVHKRFSTFAMGGTSRSKGGGGGGGGGCATCSGGSCSTCGR
jgi:putative FmdB family regulatory protein